MLQLARAAKEKSTKQDDESRRNAAPGAEPVGVSGDLVPGPSRSLQADDQRDTSQEVIIHYFTNQCGSHVGSRHYHL